MSDRSNLNFVAKWDIQAFKAKCADQRKIALEWPAFDRRMGACEEFHWTMGPWSLTFCLEIWRDKPTWHGSAAVVEEIGYETVTGNLGMKYEVPKDALLSTSSWTNVHKEQARFVLAEVFGDILRPGDKFQPANEVLGLWAMHHLVPYQGEPVWKSKLH
jgi:hypothetical protein